MVEALERPRLLIVSFFYAPFNSIGALRVTKMSRHLLELGWDVRVLTVDRDDLPSDLPLELSDDRVVRVHARDINAIPKLLLGRGRLRVYGFELPTGMRPVQVLGTLYRDVTNFPDGQIGWYRPAVAAGRALIHVWRPDVILSSALPATSHLVARSLALRHHVPWIAEYRDPWTDSRARRRAPPLYSVERLLEDRVMRTASAIVTVSDAWAAQFARRFPKTPVTVVSNGYDATDYVGAAAPPADGPLTMLYTGRLYGRQDPMPLLRAVRSVVDDGSVAPDMLRLRFVGRYLSAIRDAARSVGLLGDIVEVGEPVPHRTALAEQQRSHVLIMLLGADDDIGWRPAKLYEYLGARRPILMLGGTEAHEARAILRACGAGVALNSEADIARQIAAWSVEFRSGGSLPYSGDDTCIEQFERRALARNMDGVLRSVLNQSGVDPGAQIPT